MIYYPLSALVRSPVRAGALPPLRSRYGWIGDGAGVLTMDAYRLIGLPKAKSHPGGQTLKTLVSPL
jgi:hypothetical protein